MISFHDNPLILPSIQARLSFKDLTTRLSKGKTSPTLLNLARELYKSAFDISRPRALLYWLTLKDAGKEHVYLSEPRLEISLQLSTGYSSRFLAAAKMAAVVVCTIGSELETAARTAAAERHYLHSYIYETMGMAVLEKTTDHISRIVEKAASERGWRVSPFLSPGSVHGWDLTDQAVLCRQLDLEKINLKCGRDGVLRPFNSLSFIIGIGPAYSSVQVSSPCTVCQNSDSCTEASHLSNKPG